MFKGWATMMVKSIVFDGRKGLSRVWIIGHILTWSLTLGAVTLVDAFPWIAFPSHVSWDLYAFFVFVYYLSGLLIEKREMRSGRCNKVSEVGHLLSHVDSYKKTELVCCKELRQGFNGCNFITSFPHISTSCLPVIYHSDRITAG